MHESESRYPDKFEQKSLEHTDFNEWVRYLAHEGLQEICPVSYNEDSTDEQRAIVRDAVSSGTQQVFENRISEGLTLDDKALTVTTATLRIVEEFIVDSKMHMALAKGLAQGMAEAGLIDEDWEKYTT